MAILDRAKIDIIKIMKKAGVIITPADIVFPPNPAMGDLSLPLFALAKERGVAPGKLAQEIAQRTKPTGLIERIEAEGPYLNFFFNMDAFTKDFFAVLKKEKDQYGIGTIGKGKKYLVEFACPNPMKAFHLGHLRNTITGESVSRILENAGYKVVRVNYQGDVGMHIAKSLWGIQQLHKEFERVLKESLENRVAFLGRAYAHGAQAFENDETSKQEILTLNKKIYAHDESIGEIYTIARAWSLEKFETIYARIDTRFDEFYFESEVWERGLEIVRDFLQKGVFKKSAGAIIFPGSEHGLHDRVFITSEGNSAYEAKDLALAERRHAKHHPDMIVHVVGKEQTEYFKVVFKALEYTLPKSKGKEFHLPGGFLQLKGDKMSSRTGNVILGEQLLDEARESVKEIMKNHEVPNRTNVEQVVSDAAVKYSILRNHVSADILFDMKESVSLSGDSGPYLLYIVARIKSIIRKSQIANSKLQTSTKAKIPKKIETSEKQLLLALARFPETTMEAAQSYDPSRIAHYLFALAQGFNEFYQKCPVLQAEDPAVRKFRLHLISATATVMTKGLFLLGIKTVEEM
ncbi:MAG: arginine--tRNA ligase [bacterium]|nr:arginine--tRNA ligase [bacterium]